MTNSFPRKFSLAQMTGTYSKEFEDRSDAFQQLIGDALLTMSGGTAHSYPTKGVDGSIDSFLDLGATLSSPFEALSLPAIVECKDHNDALPKVGENILAGWGKVRVKLSKQAEKGWPNLFKPWREVRGYVYVVSSVIPSQDIREALETNIETFFNELPSERRPPIETVVVLDWNDIRLWLDSFSDIRDSWIGTGSPNILSLDQYRTGLNGFRRFLSSDALPFRPPAEDSVHHPRVLFDKLSHSASAASILLSGAGGVGKTRTSYEVALLAEKQGWRVLYVLPNDPPVTAEQLSAVVLSQCSTSTLVIFEYLDQMPNFDIGTLRHSLIPKAHEAKINFACLANSRPGFLWKSDHERDALFTRVDLSLTYEEERILSQWAVKQTAPQACDVLSDQEVFRVCGHRPIIALLVAQQLEKLALSAVLNAETIQLIRDDDPLGHWLRRRLAEDELTISEPQSFWEDARPHPRVVTAAAILAAAPDDFQGLVAAGASALNALNVDIDSQKIVNGLTELGWLEPENGSFVAIHDVVADEVVDQVIFDHTTVRTPEFAAMLSSACGRSRNFGRLTKALCRVQGAISEEKEIELRKAARSWLERHAKEIGCMIASEPPTHGSYALGAVFGGSIFEGVAVEQWSSLVTPWLEKYADDFEARHLLYRGLSVVTGDAFDELIEVSLNWLNHWHLKTTASFVLSPLLKHYDLSAVNCNKLFFWAINWLEKNGSKKEVPFVLNALLNRKDMDDLTTRRAIAHAMAWLDNFGSIQDASTGSVLGHVLGRKELEDVEACKAISLAIAWLENHGPKENVRFVLCMLLSRKDLEASDLRAVIVYVIAWLNEHWSTNNAGHVLRVLLSREELNGLEVCKTVKYAISWLDNHGQKEEAEFVLSKLLGRNDMAEIDAAKIITYAVVWLDNHANTMCADFVLNNLLCRKSMKEIDSVKIVTQAVVWLDEFGRKEEAGYILGRLLDRKDMENVEEKEAIIRHAMMWLEIHTAASGMDFVLNALLMRMDIRDVDAGKAAKYAVAWLESHPDSKSKDFVLNALLSRQDIKGLEAKMAIHYAIIWLENHCLEEDARYVFRPLLRRRDVSRPEMEKVIRYATIWLENHCVKEGARFVLRPLLRRKDVSRAEMEKVIPYATIWLENHCQGEKASFVLCALLTHNGMKKSETDMVNKHAVNWLEHHGDSEAVSFILALLLNQEANGKAFTKKIADFTVTWLNRWGENKNAGFVYIAWFNSRIVKASRKSSVEQLAKKWAAKWVSGTAPVYIFELYRLHATAPGKLILIANGHSWVRSHKNSPYAADVLTALMLQPEVVGSEVESLILIALEIAWKTGSQTIKRTLRIGLEKMPASNPLQGEIEACLAMC